MGHRRAEWRAQGDIDRLHAELTRVYTAADTREQLGKLGMTVRASSPDEFDRHIRAEMALWGKVVRESGLSAAQ